MTHSADLAGRGRTIGERQLRARTAFTEDRGSTRALTALVGAGLFAALIGAGACRSGVSEDPRFSGLDAQFRGHGEIALAEAERWEPLLTERAPRVGLCVTAPPVVDTSRWEARWTVDAGRPSPYVPPVKRLKNTLCFEEALPPEIGATSSPASGGRAQREDPKRPQNAGDRPSPHRLCPELRDGFDGASSRLACLPFRVPADPHPYETLKEALDRAYASKGALAHDAYIERIETLSRDALDAGFPLLAMRARLMAVHALRGRGTSGDWKTVDRLLDAKPAFLAAPAALRMAGEFDLARAISRCDRSIDLRTAWQDLGDASFEFQRSLGDSWPVPGVRQADLIASAGSPGEARLRLADLSRECRASGCTPRMLNTVLGTHAWHTLLDYDASDADLAQAEAELTDAIEHSQPKEDAMVLANRWVNLAFAKVRTGRDARPALERARLLLSGESTDGSGRAGLYAAWARILEGFDALRRSAPREALEACRPPVHVSGWPQLAAQALGCRARAHQRTGDRAEARREIARALAIHAEISGASIGQTISLGPGQRAEDFYFAAGLAIEDGDIGSAWQTLLDLDTLSGLEADRARCQTLSDEDHEQEQARLRAALDALSGPAPLDRIAQRDGVARSLESRLQELVRLGATCEESERSDGLARRAEAGAPKGDTSSGTSGQNPGPEAIAFALEDAVVSLWRDPGDGAIRVQKVPLPRRERIRRLDALDSALGSHVSVKEWDDLAEPFAHALIPAHRDPSRPVRISLFGSMQRVPLQALAWSAPPAGALAYDVPPRAGPTDTPRWGAMTPIVVVPSGVGGTGRGVPGPMKERTTALRDGPEGAEVPVVLGSEDRGEPAPLFIVDPAGNLATGGALASLYRNLFPRGTILHGASATRTRVESALRRTARWVHFDGHGRSDPLFSELSSIQLADGDLRADELARDAAKLELVNLSGCQTGRSPVTAGAGQFGFGRTLLSHGARWVVANRTDLPDDAAQAFNTAFYEALRAKEAPEEAFRSAISTMATTSPPSQWGGLLLLGHP